MSQSYNEEAITAINFVTNVCHTQFCQCLASFVKVFITELSVLPSVATARPYFILAIALCQQRIY